jgi:hypothetical protein
MRGLLQEAAKSSFEVFCKLVLKNKVGDMHREWIDAIQNDKRHVCIVAPRGHFKTTTLSISYPLWIMYREENQKMFLIVSSSLEQSTEIMHNIKKKIEENEVLRDVLYPDSIYQNKWSETQIETKNGHRVLCVPFGDSARGKHPDYLICDDILKTEVMDIESAKSTFYGVVFPCVNSKRGKAIVVGTRVSYVDLLGDLATKPAFKYIEHAAVVTDSSGEWIRPIFPEHFSLEHLRNIRDVMPAHLWAREYMSKPISSETSMFPSALVESACSIHQGVKDTYDKEKGTVYIGADIAVSASARADWSVFTVLEHSPGKPILVRDIIRKHLSSDENVTELERLYKQYHPTKILVEQNGVGWGAAHSCADSPILKGVADPFDTRRKIKEQIVSRLEILLRNKELALPRNDELLIELSQFGIKRDKNGKETYESLGKHDDMVISLAIAVHAADSAIPISIMLI